MIRTTSTASLFLLSILAVPAAAETAPASPPPAPAPTPAEAAPAPVAVADPAPVPVAVAEPAVEVDAFGLPCEVSFTPRTAPAKPAKPVKAAKKGRAARAARAAKPQPGFNLAGLGRGSDFALGRNDRGPAAPKGDAEVRMHAATVTPAMVGLVVREHAGELELCMTKLPRDAGASTVGLVLTIEADGTASSAQVTGATQAPAFATCLATQARTWAYPHADAAVQIEYPITVNGR